MTTSAVNTVEGITAAFIQEHLAWEWPVFPQLWQCCRETVFGCVVVGAAWPDNVASAKGIAKALGAIDSTNGVALESLRVVGVVSASYARLARTKGGPPKPEQIAQVVAESCENLCVGGRLGRLLRRHVPILLAEHFGTNAADVSVPVTIGVWVEIWHKGKHSPRTALSVEEAAELVRKRDFEFIVDEPRSLIAFRGVAAPVFFMDVPRMVLCVLWLVLRNIGGSFTHSDVEQLRRSDEPIGDHTIYKHVSALRTLLNNKSADKLGDRLLRRGAAGEYWVSGALSIAWQSRSPRAEESHLRYVDHRPRE